MTNDELYEAALEATIKLYNDRTVSVAECKRNLDALMNEIEILLDALHSMNGMEENDDQA